MEPGDFSDVSSFPSLPSVQKFFAAFVSFAVKFVFSMRWKNGGCWRVDH
jgi:hypothetical protein